MGRSWREVRRDAVSGKAEAYARTMAARDCVERAVGTAALEDVVWKRSGNRASKPESCVKKRANTK